MKRLVIDTCFAACSVALITCERRAAALELMQRGHAEALMPMIRRVMNEAESGFSDLDEIIVTSGPGTFTGMRVGIAAARALSLAAGVGLVGLGTLQLMAWGALRQLQEKARRQSSKAMASKAMASKAMASKAMANKAMVHDIMTAAAPVSAVPAPAIAVAVDARKNQIYFQLFDNQGEAMSVAQVISPGDALQALPQGRVVALGNGAMALAHALKTAPPAIAAAIKLQTELPDLQPDARDLGLRPLAAADRAQVVKPLYLRPPDAKPQTGKRIARVR